MLVRQYMTPDPIALRADQSCLDAAAIMEDRDCGLVPIVRSEEDRAPLGVVTDRDLLLALCRRGIAPGELRLGDLLGRQPVTCSPELPLARAAARMRRSRIRRLLVVDDAQQLVGVLALADLARACLTDDALQRADLAEVLEGLCR